ncbi:bifunctional DNA primase/polymerase [Sphingomonadaceae bacterium OTU29MARTA1]|nr:bifunctional DNA primase/polymerase [Sphingomonadaceae bacterium OTU29MARTA1]
MSTGFPSSSIELANEGFALHHLHPREKRPIGENWSDRPVLTVEQLRATHRPGYNIGVRLGEPSQVGGGYLHALDVDIRIPDLKDEAWDALAKLFPDLNIVDLPCVQSGSGGESRHLYVILDKPFRSKKLWVSEGKHRTFDKAKGRDVWHYDAEIELFGTGKQTALPTSIHPDTGQPYRWIRPFDFAVLDLGIGPFMPSAAIERLAVAEHATYEFETREPLTFGPGQLDRLLADIPDERIDDYHDWITIGQALHHQFGGSDAGFELWLTLSARSPKFDPKDRRNLLRKWRGFGKNRRKPVTLATVVEWAKDARLDAFRDAFDEEDEEPAASAADAPVSRAAEPVDEIDAIGGDEPLSAGEFDDILGGDDDDDADEEDEVDEIDALGSNKPVKGQSRAVTGDWISLLDINDEGAIKGTLHNVELLVRNDPRISGLPQLNEFTLETVQRTPPGFKANRRVGAAKQTRQLDGRIWRVKDALNGDLWSGERDAAVRSILEAPKSQGGYGVKVTDRDLREAIVLASHDSAFHPVQEYLQSLTWDGTPRVENLFRDYVGAPDDAYSRSVSRLMMVAAVTRIFEPGHKFDFAVILEGLQGKRKSTFIRALGRSWFGELDGEWSDQKQMIELMQCKWIMEIPELSGFNRGDVRSIKAFMSRTHDRARLAYAKRAAEFPRQCIFIGSTNDFNYLKDDTGARRWWPMPCALEGEIDTARLEANVDQLWAEALHLYRAMREAQPHGTLPLYLADPEACATATRLQEARRVESADDGFAGQIAEWLAQPIATGSIDGDFDNGKPRHRTETCLQELWSECFGNDPKSYNQQAAQQLGRSMALVRGWAICTVGSGKKRFPRYGQQRFYSLGGDAGFARREGLSA